MTKKRFKLLFFIALSFFFVYSIFFGKFGLLNKYKLNKEKEKTLQEITIELSRKDSLEKRLRELENDTFEIEKVARENYGMLKPGEKIYVRSKKKGS